MPRTYKIKKRPSYTKDELLAAVEKVNKTRVSIYKAAREFKIPEETLRRWVRSPPTHVGAGRNTVLSNEEEGLIVSAIDYVSRCGFPIGRNDIRNMVQSYVNSIRRKTPFNNGKPGLDWMRLFEKRHVGEIKKCKPELLSLARSEGLTQNTVIAFFDMYEKILKDNNLASRASCHFNLDESAVNTNRVFEKLFFGKDMRNAYLKLANSEKQCFTVLFCASASGEYLPPFVIYKSKYLYDSWTDQGPKGAVYSCSDTGWMKGQNFESWFLKVFIKYVENRDKPILLSFDGHTSHLTYIVVKAALENNIIIVCIPPNTSHALQPLDVGVFKNLKLEWKRILSDWYKQSRLTSVDKNVFPRLLKKLWEKLKPEHAIAGFKGSGLYPPNRNAIKHKIIDSQTDLVNFSSRARTKSKTEKMALRSAILNVINPPVTEETKSIQAQKSRKRTRLQCKTGEVLTSPDSVERLRKEYEERTDKTAGKKIKKIANKNSVSEKAAKKTVQTKLDKYIKPRKSVSFDDSNSSESELNKSLDISIRCGKKFDIKAVKPGISYVIVEYEGSHFPGIIKKIGKKKLKLAACKRVAFTHGSGQRMWISMLIYPML